MRDNFTGKAVTMASLRKSIYPSPPSCLHREPETPYSRDIRIVRLYLEDRRRLGQPWVVAGDDMDPWQDYTTIWAHGKHPRVTVKQVKTILADVSKTTQSARLMLYAWQGVRRNEGKPRHEELSEVISQCTAVLDRAEKMLAA